MAELVPVLTATDLYARIQSRLQPHQVAEFDGVSGEEIFRAVARIFERCGERVADWTEAGLILEASGALRSTGSVKVTWTAGTTEAVELLEGQVLCKTKWGVRYRLTESLSAGASEAPGYNATVGVEAVWSGFEGNVRAADVTTWSLPGGVDPTTAMQWGAGVTATAKAELLAGVDDGTITVAATTDMTGGAVGVLDLLAAERGLPRAENEGDVSLRARIRRLPETLTPGAILRAVNRVLESYGVAATLLEPWDYWFVIGDSDQGAIGDPDHPISRRRHFLVSIPDLGTDVDGLVIGDSELGVIGEAPIGTGDTTAAGIVAGVQQHIDSIKVGGVWALAFEEV